MSSRPELRLDWCSHAAAKYAVERWHYSGTMPVGKMVKVGVWEDGRFIGAVLFAQGNNQYQGSAFGLTMHEVCELVRVALREHQTPVSRIVAVAIRLLRSLAPGLRLVVSYADTAQGHHGGIYQASGWTYVGTAGSHEAFYTPSGKRLHSRMVSKTGQKEHFGRISRSLRTDQVVRQALPPKHKYLMPLDTEMRARVEPLSRPYPRRPRLESEVPALQAGDEGAAMRPAGSVADLVTS